ncbi:MAG TPA: 7TM diverse intracellular signaling domain-containing protein, partial [Flavobacterium sp.]|nr:7TM diverse intracellular signaling domain-containing protein [Flavobacterium sp.]
MFNRLTTFLKGPALLIALLICIPADAQVVIDSKFPPDGLSLHDHAEIVNVKQRNFTINQILQQRNLKFEKVPRENAILGFTDDHYWVKFDLRNAANERHEYYLETARPITDLAELYQISSSGNVSKAVSGDSRRFADKSYNHRKTIFKIILEPKETTHFLLHLKSDGEMISLPLMLRDADGLMNLSALEHFTFGLFYGILAIAAILYFFFYFAIKAPTFLYYSLYVLFIGLMHLSLDGYFYQYIMPEGGWFSSRAVLIFASLSTFFLGRYSQLFLDVKRHDRKLSKLFDIVYFGSAIQLALLIIPAALPYCYPLANVLGLAVLMLIIASLLRMDVLRIPVDKYFKIGVAFLIIGFVIFILNNFGQIPTSFISQNSSKFGTGVEVIFLSLSMANLIGILKSEREEFNRLALERSEEMNEMKTYFLSNISHELRTPLNAIMNLSTNIITSTIDEDARSNAKVIKTSSHTLLSSVNDILDFSKIEKRELKLENQNFKPGDILKLIRKASEIRAADAGLAFEFQQKGTLPELICGDANRLCQIINNIISNAIKFTPEGAVTVQCESIQKPQNKVQFALTITDTGIGISKDKLRNIFEAFTQNNINNKRQYGGLGLGLYISKTLVDLMNGSIYIKSTLGKGTVCRIAV